VASDALYLDISPDLMDQILGNFKGSSHAYVRNNLPQKNIAYPSLHTMLYDYCFFIVNFCIIKYGRACTLLQKNSEIEPLRTESQCAQYVLWLIIQISQDQTHVKIPGPVKQKLFFMLLR